MALVLKLKDGDQIEVKLEDGRLIKVCIEILTRSKIAAYIEAPKSIQVDRLKKDVQGDTPRNPSE